MGAASGVAETAALVIEDLWAFRADHDKCYFGADGLFGRRADIVKLRSDVARVSLPSRLIGII